MFSRRSTWVFVVLGESSRVLIVFEQILTTTRLMMPLFPTKIGDIYDPVTRKWDPSGSHVIRQQDFWFVFGMTVFILIPWFTVREVKVDIEIVSFGWPF